MICEKCGHNHATTHIKTVINGIVREYNLCNSCASQMGYGGGSITGMLASMFGDAVLPQSNAEKRCEACGTTFSEITHTGKMGCAECYEAFKEELLPYIKRVHGATTHIGKTQNSKPIAEKRDEITIDGLRQELSRLVKDEKYEQAAIIRDKIKEMEGNR